MHTRMRWILIVLLAGAGLQGCNRQDAADEAGDAGQSAQSEQDAAGQAEDAADSDTGDSVPGDESSGAITGDVVASVNGEQIPMAEFQRQAFDTQRYHVDQGGIDPNTDEGQQELLYLRRQVLNDMIDQALIEQEAARLGIGASDEEVEGRLAQFVDDLGGEEAFEASLVEAGTTRADVVEMERASIVGQKMLDRIAPDGDATAEASKVRHILCDSAEDCQVVLNRLETGEDFASLASELSADELTRETGGDLGWISEGVLVSPAFEAAALALAEGERSGIVETELGFHIIEVVEIDPEHPLSDEQRIQQREKQLLEWLSEMRDASQIEIFVEDLRDPASTE